MSKKLFTKEEIEILSNNIFVKKISAKGITYSDEFKRLFIAENEKGKLPRQIFEECGFDIDIIGMNRIKSSANRWRTTYQKVGCLNSKILESSILEGLVSEIYLLKKNMKSYKLRLNYYKLKMNC